LRINLVHGIHTVVGDPVVEGLIPYLQAAGFEVIYPDYGWIAGLETRIANPLIVRSILPYLAPGDLWIGHSNGCAIGYDLMHLSAPIAGAVFINGALEPPLLRPAQVRWIDVYFNAGDDITEAAQIAEHLGLVDPVWGELGHSGYRGTDDRIVNIDCGKTAGMPVVSGHSDFFTPAKIASWGPYLVKRIQARYAPNLISISSVSSLGGAS
jgi:hypothetical protein